MCRPAMQGTNRCEVWEVSRNDTPEPLVQVGAAHSGVGRYRHEATLLGRPSTQKGSLEGC